MKLISNEKWLLLGAGRGLGRSYLELVSSLSIEILAVSRKIELPSGFPTRTDSADWSAQIDVAEGSVQIHRADFSVREKWSELLEKFQKFSPTRIFYFAGGGPYGRFEAKDWKDHEWAWKLNFEFPAFLLHSLLKAKVRNSEFRQIVFVGSSIAESSPDPLAASYASGKHALKGLITTVQSERRLDSPSSWDVRLFSPGYMDTSLLPVNAWPRQHGDLVKSPDEVAQLLLNWIQNQDDANGHFCFPHQIKLK